MDKPESLFRFQKLTICLTSRCNLRCEMCPYPGRAESTLPRDIAFATIEAGKRLGFREIELTGGEPTLVDYCWELLDHIGSLGVQARLTTNGLRLAPENVQRLARHPNVEVMLSIDGIQETHDRIRGRRGAFENTERSLKALTDAGCRVGVNMTVKRRNLKEIVDVYERLKPYHLIWHSFTLVEPSTEEADFPRPDETDQCIRLLSEVRRRAAADGVFVTLSDRMLKTYRRRIRYPGFVMHPGTGCTVVQKSVVILSDGYAMPCFHYPWSLEGFERRVTHRSLTEIVESAEYRSEAERAIGPGGCAGCSTMCYMWDDDFFAKVMRPPIGLQLRHVFSCGKERIRKNHPAFFQFLHAIKRATGR